MTLLIALLTWSNLSYAYSSAELSEMSRGHVTHIVALPPELEAETARYFEALNLSVDQPNQTAHPRVVLVVPKQPEILAFANPKYPDVVFWNAKFFVSSPSVDVDRFVLSRERGFFYEWNRRIRDDKTKDYAAVVHQTVKALFRIGQNDPTTHQPLSAVVNPAALIDWLSRDMRDSAVNGRTVAAAIKVLVMQERSSRPIPEHPTPREDVRRSRRYVARHLTKLFWGEVWQEIKDVSAAVKLGWNEFVRTGTFPRKSEDSQPRQTVGDEVRDDLLKRASALSRVKGDLISALQMIDERRSLQPNLGADDRAKLAVEFSMTYSAILKELRKDPRKAPELFEKLGQLDGSFFKRWDKPLAALTEALGWRAYGRITVASVSHLSPDYLRAWDGLRDQLSWRSGFPGLEYAVFNGSRLVRLLNERKDVDEMGPWTAERVFGMILEVSYVEAEFKRAGLPLPPSVLRFNTATRPELTQGLVTLEFVDAVREIIAQTGRIQSGSLPGFLDDLAKMLELVEIDSIVPGFRDGLLAQLPDEPMYTRLRFALDKNAKDHGTFLSTLLNEGRIPQFLDMMGAVHPFDGDPNKQNLRDLWFTYLRSGGGHPYPSGMESLIEQFAPKFYRELNLEDANQAAVPWREALTARVAAHPAAFLRAWDAQIRVGSRVGSLVDWRRAFVRLTRRDLETLLGEPLQILGREAEFAEVQQALLARLADLLEEKQDWTDADVELSILALNRFEASSPGSQRLMALTVKALGSSHTKSSARRRLEFLQKVDVINFTDSEKFVANYVDSFIRSISTPESFARVGFQTEVLPGLEFIRSHFDPQLAKRILDALAEAYRAKPDLRGHFELKLDQHSDKLPELVEEFDLWNKLFAQLGSDRALEFVKALRSSEYPLSEFLRRELQIRLQRSGIVVGAQEVEDYVRHRLAMLTPLQRAGVFQILLDGSTTLFDQPNYRRELFGEILGSLPDATTRVRFLDLWDAAMDALPVELRSVVLSVALAESGKIGSPEQALVVLLSHMGFLEEKFGQSLAFAALPESYRRALRQIWDAAQKVDWWSAQQLLREQAGDVGQAGYRLTRILNSGSTVAYLEITHEDGHRLSVPVWRRGAVQSLETSARQLRRFARVLYRKNRRLYGFLPILVEDSIRTAKRELDPAYKREMTERMALAYRRAAVKLGYEVDAEGVIHAEGFTFSGVRNAQVQLPDGTSFWAQDLADGIPLRFVGERTPDVHAKVLPILLRLEAEVQRDLEAPVDKDRMPGQNIFSLENMRNYILDHGQAAVLRPGVHRVYIDFTQYAFAASTRALAKIIRETTGLWVWHPFGGPSLSDVDAGLRPLSYLTALAGRVLSRPDGDPAKEAYFELVHGVRARLRLLQWEEDEGFTELKAETLRQTREKIGWWRGFWLTVREKWRSFAQPKREAVRERLDQTTFVKRWREHRMDRAYRRAQRGCAADLDV